MGEIQRGDEGGREGRWEERGTEEGRGGGKEILRGVGGGGVVCQQNPGKLAPPNENPY